MNYDYWGNGNLVGKEGSIAFLVLYFHLHLGKEFATPLKQRWLPSISDSDLQNCIPHPVKFPLA